MTAGQAVRAAREANGWTQQQLADAAGTTRRYITDVEADRKGNVGSDLLARIAVALGVSLALGVYEITPPAKEEP